MNFDIGSHQTQILSYLYFQVVIANCLYVETQAVGHLGYKNYHYQLAVTDLGERFAFPLFSFVYYSFAKRSRCENYGMARHPHPPFFKIAGSAPEFHFVNYLVMSNEFHLSVSRPTDFLFGKSGYIIQQGLAKKMVICRSRLIHIETDYMQYTGIGLGPRDARFYTLNPRIAHNLNRECAIFASII